MLNTVYIKDDLNNAGELTNNKNSYSKYTYFFKSYFLTNLHSLLCKLSKRQINLTPPLNK